MSEGSRDQRYLELRLFTSSNYPWPEAGRKGKLAAPIVQINLAEISRLRNADYGDGLLQVFITDSYMGSIVRLIPKQEVRPELLTNILAQDSNDFFDPDRCRCPSGCLDYGAYQIVGFEEPVLSSPDFYALYAPEDGDPELFKQIHREIMALEDGSDRFHMFGTFSQIQYSHSEDMESEVFMAMESDLGYEWGDSGNAQIFFNRRDNGMHSFSFMWSCC